MLRVTGLCAGTSPVTSEFPAQMVSYAEIVSIWWRHHGTSAFGVCRRPFKLCTYVGFICTGVCCLALINTSTYKYMYVGLVNKAVRWITSTSGYIARAFGCVQYDRGTHCFGLHHCRRRGRNSITPVGCVFLLNCTHLMFYRFNVWYQTVDECIRNHNFEKWIVVLRKLPRVTTNVQKNKSYVGLFISYVWLFISYVGLTKSYVGLYNSYVGDKIS